MAPCDLARLADGMTLADLVDLNRRVLTAAYGDVVRATLVADVAGSKAGVVLPVVMPKDEAVPVSRRR